LDKAETVAMIGGACDEEMLDCLWHEAQSAVFGGGKVEVVKVGDETDVPCSELGENAALRVV
jgi:hypothetical protein